MEAKSPSLRKNPSRETCEGIIRRILMTEVLEKGKRAFPHGCRFHEIF